MNTPETIAALLMLHSVALLVFLLCSETSQQKLIQMSCSHNTLHLNSIYHTVILVSISKRSNFDMSLTAAPFFFEGS